MLKKGDTYRRYGGERMLRSDQQNCGGVLEAAILVNI